MVLPDGRGRPALVVAVVPLGQVGVDLGRRQIPASSAVRVARDRGLTRTSEKVHPVRRGARAAACPSPWGVSGMSVRPVWRRSRLQAVSPWRMRTTRGRELVIRPADHSEYQWRKPPCRPARHGRSAPNPHSGPRNVPDGIGVAPCAGPTRRTRRGMTTRTATRRTRLRAPPRPPVEPGRPPTGRPPPRPRPRRPPTATGARTPTASGCSCGTSTTTRCPTTTPRPSWPSGWPPATTPPAARWWPPTSAWSSTGPVATRTGASTCPT